MAEAPNILGQGTVDTTVETVYTVPGSTSAIVTVIVTNNTAGAVTGVTLYANGTADTNCLVPGVDLAAGESMRYGPIALGAADTLSLKSLTGDDVAGYTVEGIEFS